jgi:hypothetical protein
VGLAGTDSITIVVSIPVLPLRTSYAPVATFTGTVADIALTFNDASVLSALPSAGGSDGTTTGTTTETISIYDPTTGTTTTFNQTIGFTLPPSAKKRGASGAQKNGSPTGLMERRTRLRSPRAA